MVPAPRRVISQGIVVRGKAESVKRLDHAQAGVVVASSLIITAIARPRQEFLRPPVARSFPMLCRFGGASRRIGG
jgi:hypothetical protein